MILIGDVHGKINKYFSLIQKYSDQTTVQIGDFGFQKEHHWHLSNIDSPQHRILFGNHDYLPYVQMEHSMGDFLAEEIDGKKFFFVRGAKSVDAHMRVEGRDWFREEELRYGIWRELLDTYLQFEPDIVVSHDCPESLKFDRHGFTDYSLTNHLLQEIFESRPPEKWFYGHYHRSIGEDYEGTWFQCLNELETIEL